MTWRNSTAATTKKQQQQQNLAPPPPPPALPHRSYSKSESFFQRDESERVEGGAPVYFASPPLSAVLPPDFIII